MGRQRLRARQSRLRRQRRRLSRDRYRRMAAKGPGERGMRDMLQPLIDQAWEERDSIGPATKGEVRQAVDAAISALDCGEVRIADKSTGEWVVHQWLKKAVLLSFRLNPMEAISGAPGGAHWWDKVPSKFAGWGEKEFAAAAFRAVPGAIVRRGAFIAPG